VIRIELNGEVAKLPEGATVSDAVSATGADGGARGLAVAVCGDVVRRSEWPQRELREGDSVEIVRAVQGG